MKWVMLALIVTGLFALVPWSTHAALPKDIVLFMTFDEGSGTDIKDSSMYGNHGVATVESWAEGKYKWGYEFDGKTTAIEVKASDVLTNLKEPMSVGYWIMPISFPTQWMAVAEMEAAAGARTNGWKSGFSNANPVFTTYGVKDHIAAEIIEVGQWTHIAWVYDGKTAKIYINGEDGSEIAGSGSINVTQSPGVNIGAESGAPGNYAINAVLDDLWISNVAKTKEDIEDLMVVGAPVEPHGRITATWGSLKL